MADLEHIREILRQFGPTSVIDVLLIAALIYGALLVLSETRAMTQLRGAMLLLLVAVALGRLFELSVVNFLIERAFPLLLIAAVIIFQPEIRRALDRVGRAGMRGVSGRNSHEAVIDALARATVDLSLRRHGALIVIERETGLQDVIETGVPVDAHLSPELLGGIFFPNSPLHDLAVVLRETRVVAAGCVLPLASELPESDRQLGTRHRAAIGITEHTDAISVVVSEETGGISVAIGGRLTHIPDERRLRAVLEWVLGPSRGAAFAQDATLGATG